MELLKLKLLIYLQWLKDTRSNLMDKMLYATKLRQVNKNCLIHMIIKKNYSPGLLIESQTINSKLKNTTSNLAKPLLALSNSLEILKLLLASLNSLDKQFKITHSLKWEQLLLSSKNTAITLILWPQLMFSTKCSLNSTRQLKSMLHSSTLEILLIKMFMEEQVLNFTISSY